MTTDTHIPLAGVVNKIPTSPKRAVFDIPIASDDGSPEMHLPISMIDPSPYQPRLVFDMEAIQTLAQSIDLVGQVTPITVRQMPTGRYELIGGERRVRALRHLGKTTVHAVVKSLSDSEAAIHAVNDNTSKSDLTDYENGRAFHHIIESGEVRNQTELASKVGVSNATVTRCLAYMRLPPSIISMLDKKPSMIGNRCVSDFAKLCEDGHTPIVEKHVARLFNGECSQEAALADARNDAVPKAVKTNTAAPLSSHSGKPLGSITLSKKSITFKCEKGVDPEQIYAIISDALKKA